MRQGHEINKGLAKKLIAVLCVVILLCIFCEKVYAFEPETLYVYYYRFGYQDQIQEQDYTLDMDKVSQSDDGDASFAYWTCRLYSAFTPGQKAYILFESLFRNGDSMGWPILPRNVRVLEAVIVDETLILNVSEEVLNYGGTAYERAFAAELAMNALTFPQVKRLTLLIQGEKSSLPEGSMLYETELTDLL